MVSADCYVVELMEVRFELHCNHKLGIDSRVQKYVYEGALDVVVQAFVQFGIEVRAVNIVELLELGVAEIEFNVQVEGEVVADGVHGDSFRSVYRHRECKAMLGAWLREGWRRLTPPPSTYA